MCIIQASSEAGLNELDKFPEVPSMILAESRENCSRERENVWRKIKFRTLQIKSFSRFFDDEMYDGITELLLKWISNTVC